MSCFIKVIQMIKQLSVLMSLSLESRGPEQGNWRESQKN